MPSEPSYLTLREAGEQLGPIEPATLYPLPNLMARTGLGTAAFRQMRREGMQVKYVAGRGYVLGAWFIAHVVTTGKDRK